MRAKTKTQNETLTYGKEVSGSGTYSWPFMVPMVMNLNLKGSGIRPQKGLLQFHAQGFVATVTSRDAAKERRILTKALHIGEKGDIKL